MIRADRADDHELGSQADRDAGVRPDRLTTAERQALAQLRRKVHPLEMEHDIYLTQLPSALGRPGPYRRTVRVHEGEPGPLAVATMARLLFLAVVLDVLVCSVLTSTVKSGGSQT